MTALEYTEDGAPSAPTITNALPKQPLYHIIQGTTPGSGLAKNQDIRKFTPPESETVCKIGNNYYNCKRNADSDVIAPAPALAAIPENDDLRRKITKTLPICDHPAVDCSPLFREIEAAADRRHLPDFRSPYTAKLGNACTHAQAAYNSACLNGIGAAVAEYYGAYNEVLEAKTKAYQYVLNRPNGAPNHPSADSIEQQINRTPKAQVRLYCGMPYPPNEVYCNCTNDPTVSCDDYRGKWHPGEQAKGMCVDAKDYGDGKCHHWQN